MPWANLDDKFPRHPKVVGLSNGAFRLHVAGICYCNEHLTDGFIDAYAVPTLVPRFRRQTLDELVDRELWLTIGTAYEIHDFLQWNRTRAQVLAERERKSKGGRKGAESRWHKR